MGHIYSKCGSTLSREGVRTPLQSERRHQEPITLDETVSSESQLLLN